MVLNATRPINGSISDDHGNSSRASSLVLNSNVEANTSSAVEIDTNVPGPSSTRASFQLTSDATSPTVGSSPSPTMESWALPFLVTKILALRNTSCPPFEPSNYHVTTPIRTLPKPLCTAEADLFFDDTYPRYEDACLGAYCAYAIDSALRSYYTLNTSKPMWTSTRLIASAIYDEQTRIVGYSTITRAATCE